MEERLEMAYGWHLGPMVFILEPGTAWSLVLTQTESEPSEETGIQLTSTDYIAPNTSATHIFLGEREEPRKIRFSPLCFYLVRWLNEHTEGFMTTSV